MKLLKPSWVHHDEKPIFSVDVHQDCLKFATGGQGLDSGRVVIWNLLPVLNEKAELDSSVPKILCQMDNHLACVNCVRWSHSGLMLASGSDDKLIMIWRQSKGPSGVFGTGGIQKNPESWKCVYTLRGHSGDVLDLAWSPQDRWFASCSIDNTIIVWDVQNFPAMIAMLKGHTGLVKGVAWDPVGKFLASQSDDRSVKIWKSSDWTCSNTITEPFEECGGTTHILRLSWSPDGQYLVSAHAMNGGGPTAQIIEREGWKCDKDFVGHRKAVTCVRFHTSILKRQAPKSQKPQQYCCLAVGSRDRSLSVWMTALQRPLVVIHELFNDSILDLSWGPEKCILMACSGDGTVACLQFSENELGTPLSEEDRNSLYQRMYGKAALANGTSATTDMIIENPELLACTRDKIKPPSLPTMQLTNHNNNNIECPIATATTTTTIATLPSSNGFIAAESSSSTSQSTLNVNTVSSAFGQSQTATPIKAIDTQLETRTKDGKRRITPVFIPLNQDVVSTSSDLQPLNQTTSSTNFSKATSLSNDSAPAGGVENLKLIKDSTEPAQSLNKPRSNNMITEEADEERMDSRLVKCVNSKTYVDPQNFKIDENKSFTNGKRTQQALFDGGNSNSSTRITPHSNAKAAYQASTTGPKISITATTKCEFQKTALDHRVHVHNGCVQTTNGLLAKVTALYLPTGKLWETFVGSPVVNLNFCLKSVMLCSLDGSLRLLAMKTGAPLMPAITLTTAAVQCAFSPTGNMVGIITECGLLRIWNIDENCSVLATTCSDIYGKHGPVLQLIITEHGIPMVLFANGHAYSYSTRMQSWLVLNTKDPIVRHGLQSSIPKDFQRNYKNYPLTSMQSTTTMVASQSSGIDLNLMDWQSKAKICFVENQIKICETINSPLELRYWYEMLAFHLAHGNDEKRMRLLLNYLLDQGEPNILGIPKLELLEPVLNQFKAHIKWQRIYMEYNDLYECLKERHLLKQRHDEKSKKALQDAAKLNALNSKNSLSDETAAGAVAVATSSLSPPPSANKQQGGDIIIMDTTT